MIVAAAGCLMRGHSAAPASRLWALNSPRRSPQADVVPAPGQEIADLRAALAAEAEARKEADARSGRAAAEARRLEGELAQLEVDQREEVLTLRQVRVQGRNSGHRRITHQ